MSCPISVPTRILAAAAFALLVLLGVGFALPSRWQASREAHVDASPEAVLAYIDGPSGWRQWTPWPDSGLVASGPEHGAGAQISWDDPELGDGTFRITGVDGASLVRYEVRVEGGAMRTEGSVSLTPDDGGTRVAWRESGDFGWNPLMGYWARFMERAQGREMEKGLAKLGEVVTAGAPR